MQRDETRGAGVPVVATERGIGSSESRTLYQHAAEGRDRLSHFRHAQSSGKKGVDNAAKREMSINAEGEKKRQKAQPASRPLRTKTNNKLINPLCPSCICKEAKSRVLNNTALHGVKGSVK
jgi:hypothetical protein